MNSWMIAELDYNSINFIMDEQKAQIEAQKKMLDEKDAQLEELKKIIEELRAKEN